MATRLVSGSLYRYWYLVRYGTRSSRDPLKGKVGSKSEPEKCGFLGKKRDSKAMTFQDVQMDKVSKMGPHFKRFMLAIAIVACVGCSGVSSVDDAADKLSQQQCEAFDALLSDVEFQTVGVRESLWRYRQHIGQRSFSTTVTDGTLVFARIGGEPWAVLSQKVTSPLLRGRDIIYSVDLKGDVSPEVTHAFGAKSGLYLRRGPRRDASLAEHEPNIGQWEGQRVSVTASMPEEFDYVEVGFIYQGGSGELSARNPSLQLAECVAAP